MKSLPKEYQLLKELSRQKDIYFATAVKRDRYRLTDIYDYIKKRSPFCLFSLKRSFLVN